MGLIETCDSHRHQIVFLFVRAFNLLIAVGKFNIIIFYVNMPKICFTITYQN